MEVEKTNSIAPETLLAFLLNPDSYPHRPKRVHLKETHSSYVLLAAPYAYKVKKPVNFGFLDFSTLEKRRYFCEREILLNRRFCTRIHLGVVPISLREGKLTFGPGDAIVEYAIKMRKLADRYFMLALLKKGQVGTNELDRLVSALQTFYEAQHPGPEIAEWGRIEKLKISTDENFRQTENFVGFTISRPAFETIRFYTDSFYSKDGALFEDRIREHRIRDCHGDLHLEHIHITPKAISIYDCIEFNDRFRYTDVASDLAFLAMDRDFQGRPDLSRQFTAKIIDALNDPAMEHLMDFYKCYRAYVRGKVETFHQSVSGLPARKKSEIRARAERYFRLALQYVVCGSKPMVMIIMGRVASGKSMLARSLARELSWEIFSSDPIRKQLAGVPLYERPEPAARCRLYSKAMTEKTYGALRANAIGQVEKQRSVIIDATFSSRRHREELVNQLCALGVDYCFVETKASEETLKTRLVKREAKLNVVSDARMEDFELLTRSYEVPAEFGPDHLVSVSTDSALEATVVETLKKLACIAHPPRRMSDAGSSRGILRAPPDESPAFRKDLF
ncbi:MAG TPA: AAA family ATPase [Chthoniobacterales bacterium]|nr:AAA family ATPase [Chthoniobacterales bacterium]